MNGPSSIAGAAQRGWALTVVVRVVLLVAVFAQLVFLAGRYRLRRDMTAEQVYTLTPSTQRVLDGLQDRLLIECYFTADDKLPASVQHQRRELRAVLDEYVARSKGKVQLQFFDPQSDEVLRQKAERLQMQPDVIENLEIGELKQQVLWQGMRLRYGADRQHVIPRLQLLPSTFQYESLLTPAIKELTVVDKPKVKVLAPPLQSGSRGIPKSWRQIRNVTRYDFSDLDLSDGKLVPEDTDILLLVRPRDLNDRAKYAIDQYLMSGGKVVVFADTDDVDIGNQDHRSYVVWPMEYDSGDSKVKFVDMLATYGVELRTELVADLFRGNNATAQAFMARLVQTTTGLQHEQVFYPYLFHPLGVDWGSEQVAVQLATDPQTKQVDRERAAQYQAAFKHGLKNDHPLALGQTIGPDLFWPCPVDLVDKLPDGVRGDVIARTSPLTLLEKRPRTLNPFGDRAEPTAMFEALQRFQATIWGKLLAEPRRQVGLMVALEGTFPSAFAGKPLPPRRPPPPEPLPDPLTGRVGKEGEPASAQTDSDAVGPPVTGEGAAAEDDKDKDPPFRERAEPGAQLVVVGDSDFLRDDMLTYVYLQQGRSLVVGPASDQRAWAFYNAILDWLVQDDDLIALRSKVGTDRTIRLGEHDVMAGESAERFLQRVSRKAAILQWVNVLGPAVLLLVLWLVVAIRRARRKAAFVGSVQ